jgi:hypothetical protein
MMNGSVGFPDNLIEKPVPICRPQTEPLSCSQGRTISKRPGLGAKRNSPCAGTEDREDKQLLFPITLVPAEDVKNLQLFDAD